MAKQKMVLCAETGILYDSPSTAGKLNNWDASNIACSCRLEQSTSNRLHWRYFTDGDWLKYKHKITQITDNTWKIDFTQEEMAFFVGRNGTVYMYTNKINGKKYIGQTWHPEVRFNQHIKQAYTVGRDTYVFHYALKKYGIEGFEYTRLHEHIETAEELDKLEKEAIEQYDSIVPKGYNIKGGGAGGGAVRYEGVLEKMRDRYLVPLYCIDLQKEFKSSKYAVEELGLDINYTISQPPRMQKFDWWYSQKHYWQYVEDGRKYYTLDEVMKLHKDSTSNSYNRDKTKRPVICIETQVVYSSIGDAAKAVNGNVTNITYVCKKKTGKKAMNTYLGFHWDYYEEGREYNIEDYIPAGHICPVRCIETGMVYNNMRYAAKFINPIADNEELQRLGTCIHRSIKSKCMGAGFHWEYYTEGASIASLEEYKTPMSRDIVCIETGKIYKTAVDIQKELGCASTNIIRCCKGKARSVYGLHWKYKEEE